MKFIIGRKEYGRKKCRQAGLLCWSDCLLCSLNMNLATDLSKPSGLILD